MRRLFMVLAALLLAFTFFPAQAGAATGPVTNGTGFTTTAVAPFFENPFVVDRCTIGVVGTDSGGRKVAITAAHCFESGGVKPIGTPVYRWVNGQQGQRQQIGTLADRGLNGGNGTDWAVILLNSDADLRSNGPGARIDGVADIPPQGQIYCKDGTGSGVRCGTLTGSTSNRFQGTAFAIGGDSGGPAWTGGETKFIGMVRGPGEQIRGSAVFAEIATTPSPVGDGFVATNN